MKKLYSLLLLMFFVFMSANTFAQTTNSVAEDTKAEKGHKDKRAMSVKCDCCNSTYSAEKIADHAKTCCKTDSGTGSTNMSASKKAMSVKCDCCNSTYSAEKIADHAKTCCKTDSGTGSTNMSASKKAMSVKCDCCNSTYSAEKIADHAKTCCKSGTDGTTNSTK